MATEAGSPSPGPPPTRGEPEPGGWTVFAAVVLLIAGMLNALWGLAAVVDGDVVTVGGRDVIVWDFTAWGWIHLVLGVIMVLTAAGLLVVKEWARWVAVWFAGANGILQVGVITAFPLWSILIIALDLIVIYQLTDRWDRQLRRPAA